MNQEELDHVVAVIARTTGRSVSLDDVQGRVIAYDMTLPTTDRARIESVLRKAVTEEAHGWETLNALSTRTAPFIVPANPGLGYLSRVCLPLLHRGLRVGYLWILTRDENDDPEPILESVSAGRVDLEDLAERVLVGLGLNDPRRERHEDALLRSLRGEESPTPDAEVSETLSGAAPKAVFVFSSRSALAADEQVSPFAIRQAASDAARAFQDRRLLLASDLRHTVVISSDLSPDDAADFALRYELGIGLRTGAPSSATSDHGRYWATSASWIAPQQMRRRYLEATVTLQALAVDPSVSEHTYRDIGVYQFLSQVSELGTLSSRYTTLANHRHGPELLETLERIYDSGAARQALADELHVHRTSLYNRLQRIGAIIEADPLSPSVRQDLHLALKARRWQQRPQLFVSPSLH